jgi:NmrA-like family
MIVRRLGRSCLFDGQGENHPMFAITGITGKVGGEVARNLLAGNQPVRAVVRDPRKGEPWARLGCDLVRADINDAGALTSGPKVCSCSFRRTSIRRRTFAKRGRRLPR